MELKIGEIFNFHGIILQVCEVKDSARCKGCFFKNYPLSLCPPHTCVAIGRKDKKDIIFKKLINKMTKEEAKNCYLLFKHLQRVRKFNLNPALASG